MEMPDVSHGELLERLEAVRRDVERAFMIGMRLFAASVGGATMLAGAFLTLYLRSERHETQLAAFDRTAQQLEAQVQVNGDRIVSIEATRFTGKDGAQIEARLSTQIGQVAEQLNKALLVQAAILERLPDKRGGS